jgi:glycosyltransferase involved in cell wall biosynthesis
MKKVSVQVLTYRHEDCIERCLNSIIGQKFSNFEIVVGVDKSLDRTLKIVQEIAKKSKVPIKIIEQRERVGAFKNFIDINSSSTGKFIAICDGDDFWTDENKLSKQFDFMEKNPNLIISFHDSNLVNSSGELINILPSSKHKNRNHSQSYLIEHESFMPSSSIMYKNIDLKEFNRLFLGLDYIVDLPLVIYLLEFGSIGYLEDNMSNYVSSSTDNAWSSKSTSFRNIEAIKMFELINKYTINKYQTIIIKKIHRNLINIFLYEISKGEITIARTSLKIIKSNRYRSLNFKRSILLGILLIVRRIFGIWSTELLFKVFIRLGILNYA